MTDAQAALAHVREALAAGPTPGPWVTMPANAGVHCVARINAWEAVPPGDCELSHDSIDASFIAACSPANMTAILAHVEAQEAEIERLTAALQYEQHRADRQGTHGDGCADWGPSHYECAIRERDELRRQLDEARAERDAMSNVLPGYYYMDPPDGGDVPLGEQVRRMALDARRYRWLRENLGKWRIETYQTPEQSMIELHVIGDSCFYSGESFDRIIDGLTRPAEES